MGAASGNAAAALGQFLMQWASQNKQDKQFRMGQEMENQRYNDGLARSDRQFQFMQDQAQVDNDWRTSQSQAQAASEAAAREDQLGKDARELRMSGVTGGSTMSMVPSIGEMPSLPEQSGGMDAGMLGKALQAIGTPKMEAPALNATLMRADTPLGWDPGKDIGHQREIAQRNHVTPFQQMQHDADMKFKQLAANNASAHLGIARQEANTRAAESRVPAVKPATDGQNLAAGYAARMRTAEQALSAGPEGGESLEVAGSPTWGSNALGIIPFVGDAARRKAQSPEQQQYDVLKSDWIAAKLRKESGAAIAPTEREAEDRTYFKQIGDAPETVELKKIRRQIAEQALQQQAGSAYVNTDQIESPQLNEQRRKYDTAAAVLISQGKDISVLGRRP